MDTFTGREYLLIDIANCYGFDRLSWQARILWSESHMHDLPDLFDTAKSPVLFRKAARALQLVDVGKPTNHIMGLDATASGIQIMAAMSGCWKTASEVNLVDEGERKDLYSSIGTYMNTIMGIQRYQRNDMKDPIMTTFYGSTAQPKKIFGEGTEELKAFYGVLNERLPGAVRVLKVIQQFWDPTVTHHEWTLPDGHTAFVPVVGTDEKNLEIDELDHLRMAYRTQVLGTRSQSRALAANVVHSVDAWVCRQMVIMAQKQGFWLAPIHDCFYTSPKYMNQVRRNYSILLAWIADENVLENILRNISKSPVSIRKASNNLSEAILQSNYALS
jgi:DNA-directed RNA polymerase